MKQHKDWIDTLKAVCMICVYLRHSETYYGCSGVMGYMVNPFYVNAFFFISGYLFFGKWLDYGILTWGGVFASC